jgi:nitrite reductase (NO-forming)
MRVDHSGTPTNVESQAGWWVMTTMLGVLALIVALVAFALATDDDSSAGSDEAGGETEFDVELGDLYVKPARIDVPAGVEVTLHVSNAGAMQHDLKVDGDAGTALLDPGSDETIVIGPFAADRQAWCTVPGHKEAGMLMDITVIGGTTTDGHAAASTGAAGSTSASTGAQIDATMAPSDTWEPRDAVLAPAEEAAIHEVAIDATEELVEVAPGVTQMMWTFNGQVPGPTLRGNVGDTFRITLTNTGTLGHSIDFHASEVAWDDEMRTIQPGESLVYEFTAAHTGAYMYHCGTAPTLHHIGNGMYGAIIIDPPDLTEVDKEFVFIQSELYLGAEGDVGDLTKMIDEEWDAVVFNGYYNQYQHAPIHVETGKRYRIWVVDAGPNENSAFHVVGTIFDTSYKEGAYLLQPGDSAGGSQVLDLQPAQGGFVETSFAEDGLYPFVTHKFANPGKGALGFFAVGDVDTSAIGGH